MTVDYGLLTVVSHCRYCNVTGTGSCPFLCCGWGYENVTEVLKKNCNCQFKWCCRVQCQECTEVNRRYRCKAETSVLAGSTPVVTTASPTNKQQTRPRRKRKNRKKVAG